MGFLELKEFIATLIFGKLLQIILGLCPVKVRLLIVVPNHLGLVTWEACDFTVRIRLSKSPGKRFLLLALRLES